MVSTHAKGMVWRAHRPLVWYMLGESSVGAVRVTVRSATPLGFECYAASSANPMPMASPPSSDAPWIAEPCGGRRYERRVFDLRLRPQLAHVLEAGHAEAGTEAQPRLDEAEGAPAAGSATAGAAQAGASIASSTQA